MFSSALTLTDLNDFITPSQACIKPVEEVKPDDLVKEPGAASTQIQVDASGAYYEVEVSNTPSTTAPATTRRKLEQAQISLNDCLACSGCITSAESVLITMQSHIEVLDILSKNPKTGPLHKIPVLSISPQCIASLASSISSSSGVVISTLAILRRVRSFCKSVLGFEHVFDTTFSRHLALREHTREFEERKRDPTAGKLPMLASACPGWVCYAEKTHSEMLPFIARTKSPQQIMGTLVKYWMAKKWGKNPDQVYHVSVMPCYDKKLEASRTDFFNDVYSTRDVDCVITTGELELLMQEHGWDLSKRVDHEDELPSSSSSTAEELMFPELLSHPGSSSGSYLQSLINATYRDHREEKLELTIKAIRTADYEEHTLTRSSGVPVFRGAKCYGFRNLQNVVRKIGRDAGVQTSKGAAGRLAGRGGARRPVASGVLDKSYEYVEVMACPGGCINGGGQLRPQERRDEEGHTRDWAADGVAIPDRTAGDGSQAQGYANKWSDREWMTKVEAMYWNGLPTPPASPSTPAAPFVTPDYAAPDELAARILRELCQSKQDVSVWSETMDDEAEALRRKLFRTEYHAVESEVLGIAVKW